MLYEIKRKQLLSYLDIYLRKRLNMEMILISIVDRLKKGNHITEKQFGSIIKFIEREPQFVSKNRNQIRDYFNPLISNQRKDTINGNDLTQFFQN